MTGSDAVASKAGRQRLDQFLATRGLADSRTRAARLILAGLVEIDGAVELRPGRLVEPTASAKITGVDHPFASRGGVKLAAALEAFSIPVEGLTCLDIGASTGGFTDVLLTRRARHVYAVDVGHDQLAPRLRGDARVSVLDGMNARHLTRAEIPEPVQIIVCDASFISLETILPAPLALAAADATLIALIKPQFEVGAGRVGKGGIVRDPVLHDAVCRRIEDWLARQPSWHVRGLCPSPITGSDGNREFLICARRAA